MQFKLGQYKEEYHDKFKALTVDPASAESLKTGKISAIVRRKNTNYRGNVIICASDKKDGVFPSGCTICSAELFDVKPACDLTDEEKRMTQIPIDAMAWSLDVGYVWFFKEPKSLIEFPVKNKRGLWTLVYSKDVIMEYPEYALVDDETRKRVRRFRKVGYTVIAIGGVIVVSAGCFLWGWISSLF